MEQDEMGAPVEPALVVPVSTVPLWV